ncbi:phytanoyl-CoA dioxygenase family protein [Nocardia sp. CA-107356]|uniref:phytanoyl-CoA dioxygenase family protein n=1 Tax=Nocardia sp. CA-107356 TaxID=3239972 RepID=UPI003D8F44DC
MAIWPDSVGSPALSGTVGLRCRLGDTGTVVPVEVEVGDIVVFALLTPHRSGPNVSSAHGRPTSCSTPWMGRMCCATRRAAV